MGKIRTYIKTFDVNGDYNPDFVEISDSVLRVGDVEQSIENGDFEIGLIRNSALRLTVRNDDGRFSESNNVNSIFENRRKDSIIRVTWSRNPNPLYVGFFKPGTRPLDIEVTLFEGLLNEITTVQNLKDQNLDFQILGYESKLQELEVPFGLLNGSMNYEDILLVCLNQAPFNDYVNVSAGDINVAINQVPDDIDDLENRTVREALNQILKLSSSVLYIDKDLNCIVSDRSPSATVVKEFFGQASIQGNENIIQLNTYRDGVNRVKNFFTWDETNLVASDATSISNFGVQKEEFNSRLIDVASTSKINAILQEYRDSFKDPKIEFEILTNIEADTTGINILDRVTVDYPTVYFAFGNDIISRYGIGVYGESRYPFGFFDLVIPDNIGFKVISKKTSATNNTVSYKLREI